MLAHSSAYRMGTPNCPLGKLYEKLPCRDVRLGARMTAIRFDGQITVYDARDSQSPCYACVFPPEATFEETRCATMGVFAPLVGIIGTMQAAEALKLLSGAGRPLTGRLLMLDGRAMEFSEVRIARQANCPVCGAGH